MSIPSHIIEQINSQADLVSIIGRHTTLKKAGNEYKGCCPFHGEKSPSFYVNPQKNLYHCFGCGVSGNAIGFLKDYENLTFVEAVKELSKQTGIEIPEEDNRNISYKKTSSKQPVASQTKSANFQSSEQGNSQFNSTQFNRSQFNNTQSNNFQTNNTQTQNNQHTANKYNNPTTTSNTEFDAQGGFYQQQDNGLNHYYSDIEAGGYADYAPPSDGDVHLVDAIDHAVDDFLFDVQNQFPEQLVGNPPPVQEEEADGNLYELLERIHAFYQQNLYKNPRALGYFQSRKLSDETIKTFGLGYAPTGWQHLEEAFPNDIEGLRLLGLVRKSEKGRDFDLLRDRVIFVIRDNQGRVVGFAGRALDNEVKPKYINSSDSPVFHKQHVLYGYYESRQQRANDWLVVEGYMDVIALYQAGIYGAVASMGTAVNEQQISRLLTLNPLLTLSFDGDAAGQKAAWRTLEVSLPILTDDKSLRFLTLPDNHDPDTYVAEYGKEAMQQQIANATPLSQYVYDYLSARHDLTLAEGKAKLMADVRTLTNLLPKGSSFRHLLNNDMYQRLSGRKMSNRVTRDIMLNFNSTLTLNLNIYLCLLYQPSLLADDPIDKIWRDSGVKKVRLSEVDGKRVHSQGIDLPNLPSWQDLGDNNLVELVECIKALLPQLPKDTNLASHCIIAGLSSQLQQTLANHWHDFYQNLVERNVLDIGQLLQELLVQLLDKSLLAQQKNNPNILVLKLLINRRRTLMSWSQTLYDDK